MCAEHFQFGWKAQMVRSLKVLQLTFLYSGMRSQLLHPRIKDNSTDGFRQWPFTSVQFWGENPTGMWKLHVDQIVSLHLTGSN
jgi:hypothetical protein